MKKEFDFAVSSIGDTVLYVAIGSTASILVLPEDPSVRIHVSDAGIRIEWAVLRGYSGYPSLYTVASHWLAWSELEVANAILKKRFNFKIER